MPAGRPCQSPSGLQKARRGVDADVARKELERCRFLEAMGILDTAPEPFTDAVVSAAASIANVPLAAISLLDRRRQWFKSSCGFEPVETPRDLAFCNHTICATTPLVVEDARLDPRFMSNPAVTGDMRICFYAGYPLVVRGHAVGALCVIDDHPRRLTDAQSARLAALAAGTVAWLARRAGAGRR